MEDIMQGEPRRSLKKVVVSPENVRFLLLSKDAHILHAESHIRWKKSFVICWYRIIGLENERWAGHTWKAFGRRLLHFHQLVETCCVTFSVDHDHEHDHDLLEGGLIEWLLKADFDHADQLLQGEHQGGKKLVWRQRRIGDPLLVELDLLPWQMYL